MFQAMCLIMSADLGFYSGICYDLNNITLLGGDNYPRTTTAAYYLRFHYKKIIPQRQVCAPSAAKTFVQSGDTEKNKKVPENDGI